MNIHEEIEKFGLKVDRIFLFGSRAKGNYTKDSDWDFYIIVDKDLDFAFKRKLYAQIRKKVSGTKNTQSHTYSIVTCCSSKKK